MFFELLIEKEESLNLKGAEHQELLDKYLNEDREIIKFIKTLILDMLITNLDESEGKV